MEKNPENYYQKFLRVISEKCERKYFFLLVIGSWDEKWGVFVWEGTVDTKKSKSGDLPIIRLPKEI